MIKSCPNVEQLGFDSGTLTNHFLVALDTVFTNNTTWKLKNIVAPVGTEGTWSGWNMVVARLFVSLLTHLTINRTDDTYEEFKMSLQSI